MNFLKQLFWRHIWKYTSEKTETNATSVNLDIFENAIWGNIYKNTAV